MGINVDTDEVQEETGDHVCLKSDSGFRVVGLSNVYFFSLFSFFVLQQNQMMHILEFGKHQGRIQK